MSNPAEAGGDQEKSQGHGRERAHAEWEAETYLFASSPSTPRERTADILVRFQAVSSDRPCLDSRTVFISSQCSLVEVRRQIQRYFQCLYERGFIFLRQQREISRSQERAIKLLDVLPKCSLGQPRSSFVFPETQYKKVTFDKEGRRNLVMCVGIVYICQASTEKAWPLKNLREELSGNSILTDCFAFIPASITSANQDSLDLKIDAVNHLASTGEIAKLQQALTRLPSDINLKKIRDQRSATPIHYAAQNGHVEACEVLIGRFGYDILYAKDCSLRTPLHCALHAMKLEVVCYLLHLSPDLEWHDRLGFSCARMLHGLNTHDTELLMKRLEPEALDPQLLLHFAVFALASRDIKQALRYCRLVPAVSAPFYRPPLHLAAELGNLDIIQALLCNDVVRKSPYRRKFSAPTSDSDEANNNSFETSGFAHNTSDLGQQTPRSQELSYRLITNLPDTESGCQTDRTDSGISLCSVKNKGKDNKTKKNKGKKRVHPRDPDIVSELDVLLEEDVEDARHSVLCRDSDGHLPFHYACQHGHHAALCLLYFDDMSQADFVKGIKLALNWNRHEVIRTLPTLREEYTLDGDLLSSIIKESERDICMIGHALLPLLRPHPLLMTRLLPHAAMTGAGDVVQMLLKMNVPPGTPDFLGRTPLHEACQHNHKHVVGLLLNEAGADPNTRDWRGSTPLHYACAAGHLEVVDMLLESKRTVPDCTDVRGRTPLLTAAHCNQQHVLSALVTRHLPRLSPMHVDVEGRSVLHYLNNVPVNVMKELVRGVSEIESQETHTPRAQPSQRTTEPFFVPPVYDLAREAELRDIWDDPAYPNNKTDVRGKHAKRNSQRKERLMITISCKRCGKSFSCTPRTKNWYHACSNPGIMSGAPPSISTNTLGRNLVRLPTFLPAGTEESSKDPNITRHVQTLPVNRHATPADCELTPLDVAILNNNIPVIAEILQVFPHLAKRQSTAVLATRMANVEALRMLNKTSYSKPFLTHLLHVACMQNAADTVTKAQFIKFIKLLFKLGASPNYIPNPKDFEDDCLSPSEESLVPFMALEVAAILGDFNLVNLLLENGASVSICFAVHLAAFKGNTNMLKKLLPYWKEGRWKPYIKGFSEDANELVRVCTLESGLVQAACASEQVSMDLLKLVVEEEKDILSSKKILTHHMVFAIRPLVCLMTKPTIMNKILYKHIDEMAEDDHVCQHLPLSNLLRCPLRSVRRKHIETMAVYLLQQGAYLSEMRVSKKSQVHVACEVFVLGVKRRMWKLVEVLLIEAGKDIWSCLLAPYHTCHKYVYRRWIDDAFVKRDPTDEWSGGAKGYLCLSKGMLRVFRLLPVNLLRHFLNKGLETMQESSLDGLRNILMPREPGDTMPRIRSPRPQSLTRPEQVPSPMSPPLIPPGSPNLRSTPKPESPSQSAASQRPTSPRPEAASPRPGAASPRPGAASPRPGAVSPKPGAASPRPGTGSSRPGAASPRPGTGSSRPGAASPKPGAASPRPGAASPRPGAVSTKPGAASPRPGTESSRPGAASPRPGTGSSRPGAASPRPEAITPGHEAATPEHDSSSLRPGVASPRPRAASPRAGTASLRPRAVRAMVNGGEHELHMQMMIQLLAYQIRQAGGTRGHLMVLSKLTLLCPPLLARSLSVLRFHLSRYTWLPHVPYHALSAAVKKHSRSRKVIQSLSHELMEVSLWIKLSALPVQQVMTIQEQGLTLLHVACLFGDVRLAKACLTVVISPLSSNTRSWSGLTAIEVAAAHGSTRLMEILLKNKALPPKSVLVAACVGKSYTDFYTEKSDQARLPDEKTKLFMIQWCAKSLKDIDLAFNHQKYGTVFDVVLKKRHWAIFDWLLSNTDAAPLSKLLARCREFVRLADAPEVVITRLLKSLGDVFLHLPDEVMHKFLLALTLRADSVLERVVRCLIALNYFSSHGRLLALVTARGTHEETIMHNMCRVGHVHSLKLFLCLFSQNICGNAEISDFLDAVDRSGCTPLWYCLALKRWTMAEYLITSGIRVSPKRAVPDFCVKRSFNLCHSHAPEVPPVDRFLRRPSLILRNNSSQVLQILSPESDHLLELYRNPPSPAPSPPAAPQLLPLEDTPTKGMMGRTFNDSGFSVSDGDVTMSSESDADRRRNLRYLLALIHYAGLKGATLVHAAAAVGDKDLLEGLSKSPYCSAQLAFSRTFSPFIYALANSRIDTITACLQCGLGPYDDDPVSYTLARAVLANCGIRDSEPALRGMLAHQKVSSETVAAVMDLISTRSPWSQKVRKICTHVSASKHTCLEPDLVKLVQDVVRARKGVVSEVLLVAAGVTGKLWVFKAILDSVESKAKLAELCTRPIVPKASFIDLLYLFAPRRMALEAYAPEYFDHMKRRGVVSEGEIDLHYAIPKRSKIYLFAPQQSTTILRCISSETRLVLNPQTLRAAITKNLLPMLEMVIKDHIRNRMPLQPSTLWFDSIYKACTIGDVHYVNTVCAANLNVKVNVLQNALLRALCIACLHRNKQIANRLLLFKLPLLTPVLDLPGDFYLQPQLALEAAIEGGDSVVASLILQTMEETGISPNTDDILRAIFMAFRKGMEPIIDNLLMFAHYVAPDLVSLKVCHRLFLVAARSGHGRICSKFLNLDKLNVTAVDRQGFTALHYACMYNRFSLVRYIIAAAPSSVEATTPEGLTPLDLARCMGNWELAFELIGEHSAVRGDGFQGPEVYGWMKRLLIQNADYVDDESHDLRSACHMSREMTVLNLIRRSDDRAARCLLEVAQESMVSCMLDYYPAYPLFHMCAKHNCQSSLQLLLRLIDAQPQINTKHFLEREVEGMIPLALAIRGGHVRCTRLLIAAHFPTKWRLGSTEESILHIAARGGNEEIVQMVTERASNNFLQAQDKDGLIPATTAIAYGNHHVVKLLLRGLRFAEKLHHSHLQTTYWCILCLLDLCVGWSKSFQEGRSITLNRKGRNVFQRHRTEAGFTNCSDVSCRAVMGRVLDSPEGHACLRKWITPEAKKVARQRDGPWRPKPDLAVFYTEGLGSRYNLSHTLDTLEAWKRAGASPEITEGALGCMQYADRGHRSELFLMLSHMTRFEAMLHVIRKGQDELASYLYSKLHPAFEPGQKQNFFHHACAQGLSSLASVMISVDPEINFLAGPGIQGSEATALDLALAFGHSKTAEVLLQNLEREAIKDSVTELRALTPYLSPNMQWNLGMAKIGDPAWKASTDFSRNRLSYIDLYLITHQKDTSFPGSMLPRDIMDVTVSGKRLEVDHITMKDCVAELVVDDTWFTAHMLSRAVLGRYHTELDKDSKDWQMIDRITLHCLPPSSIEEAKVVVQGHKLHDFIKVEKHKNKEGFLQFSVTQGAFPLSLTPIDNVRNRLINDILPEFKRRLAVMHGLTIDITVDWNSVESQHDLDTQRHLISILAGETGSSPLAGLTAVMDTCTHLLKDMAQLVNRKSAQEITKMLASTKTIVVKYVKELPLGRGNLELPLESRMLWYYSLDKEQNLIYNSNLFSLYALTRTTHTLFTCLAPSLRRFPQPPPNALRSAFTPDMEPPPPSQKERDTSEATEASSECGEHSITMEGRSNATTEGTTTNEKSGATTTNDRSGAYTNVSDAGGTVAPSDVMTDAFWAMESPGEDLSRLVPSPGEMQAPEKPSPLISPHRKPVVKLVEVDDDSGVVLDIDWDTFAFLPEIKRLLHFIRNSVTRELERVADSYAALQPLQLSVGTVLIRCVFSTEGAGLDLSSNTLTINLHCHSQLDETWAVGAIDSDSFFFEKRTHHLCSRWRTGSMQMSASKDRSTRYLTQALGFPVSLPGDGQNMLELLCRIEGRQMTHPYDLLKVFLKSLTTNVNRGYVKAVITAFTFSGNCWLVGKADVPSTQWCWLRMADVANRKKGERYLVLKRSESGRSTFHTMRGSDVLSAVPGSLGGVWHKRDQAPEVPKGDLQADIITDHVQLITVDGHIFFTAQSRTASDFLASLPMNVEIGIGTESPVTKALWLDDVFLRPMELGNDRLHPLASTHPSAPFMMQCWRLATSFGFHLIFDLMETGYEDPGTKDQKLLICSRLVLETLKDVTDLELFEPEIVKIVRKLLSNLGTLTISQKPPNEALDIIRGKKLFEEEADIYLLTERDLLLTPSPSVWGERIGLRWPKAFTESLRCALCDVFSIQVRSDLSTFFNKKLSRRIPQQDISFIEFAGRTNKLRTLALCHEVVTGFFAALNHFVERYLSGMRKLKADLTSVVFFEDIEVGPVVSFHTGVLKIGLFKGGHPVDRQTFARDLLVAVAVDEDIDDADLAPVKLEAPKVQLLRRNRVQYQCRGMSVASSARRRAPKVNTIVKAPSDSKYTVERAVQRLLAGVEAGKTGDITDSLDIGANVNSVNENDETPLVLAAKARNYVIQEILLGRGADVTWADQAGTTALHYEAGYGDCEAVKLLLAHGADPNAMDMLGRTPLHYSVTNGHADTIDTLMFCGANALITNKEGHSPCALCQNKPQRQVMRRSEITVKGLVTGHVLVDHLVLEADTAYHPSGMGISLRTPQTMGLAKTRLIIRRVTPEYSTCALVPAGKEQLLSDIFEFRVSGARIDGSMILRIPIHGQPGSYDDLYVKTDSGQYSAALQAVKQGGDLEWFCHVRMSLNDVQALILVTRPRIEHFIVTKTGGDYVSSLDSRLRVQVLQNTFKANQELALEVLTSPTFDEEVFDNVMSLSHFYSVTAVGDKKETPLDDLIISIPLPDSFFGQGDMFVLLCRIKAPGKALLDEEQWDVISKNPDVQEGMVKFRTPSLGLFCLLEKARHKPGGHVLSADTSAVRHVSRLHEKADEGAHDVVVFALARETSGTAGTSHGQAEVVVEITPSYKLHGRLEVWKGQGYVDHKPSSSNTFVAHAMQEFIVTVGGCCQEADPHLSTLLFHPRRENTMRFSVAPRHLAETMVSWVDVFSTSSDPPRAPSQMTCVSGISKGDSSIQDVERRKNTNHVSKLMLKLPWPRTQKQQEEDRLIKFSALSPFTPDQNTGILPSVSWGLGADWVKVAILLGISPSVINSVKDVRKLNDGQRAYEVLEQWRASRSHRQDRGVFELLVTLQKGGREDLVKVVLNRLRNWLAVHGVTTGPMASMLLEKSLSTPRTEGDCDVDTRGDSDALEPMSLEFLKPLSRVMGHRFDLAADLGISKPELEIIMADPLIPSNEDKMFKLLLLSRDKHEKPEDALKMLIDLTRVKKLQAALSWVLQTTKRWVVLQGTTDDHFSHAVGEILYNLDIV